MLRTVRLLVIAGLVGAATMGGGGVAAAAGLDDGMVTDAATNCGNSVSVISPRDSSKPVTAAQLHLPRAADKMLARAAKLGVHWLPTITCQPVQDGHRPQPTKATDSGSTTSSNWSGYEVDTPDVLLVEAQWQVPLVTTTVGQAWSTIWPGLGQGNNHPGKLIQAGTEQNVRCLTGDCGGQVQDDFFWFEIFPDEAQQRITDLALSAGDDVYTSVFYNPSQQKAIFELCDWDENDCVAVAVPSAPPEPTVEWIVERPGVFGGDQLHPLADFGSVVLQGCNYITSGADGSTGVTLEDGNPTRITMENENRVLSTPSAVASGGLAFTTTWHGSS
jgi:Peptidase A4 family